ncbi:adenylosuccinate lyase [Nonomuraea solani]|uniref:Adenylosuccinate lyase n=1 Tax=Nonomuraea solani TaxID=1144553 RepID=A0A1H6F297_9ACTN|nr:adenylosuccinate lyase [Nonomuraea solani]SEH03074.1 adenylosuccinate lyase [Nonomuraea solani]
MDKEFSVGPDVVLPLDEGRYGSPRMREIFSKVNRYRLWLTVEREVARVQGELGVIPRDAAAAIDAMGRDGIDPAAISAAETWTGHELAAFVHVLSVSAGAHGRWVHFGLTSSDVIDTGVALQLAQAIALLGQELRTLTDSCRRHTTKYADLTMTGRTHGQYAEPITLGGKFAVYLDALLRTSDRLAELSPRVLVGKVGGAVGTGAAFGHLGTELERRVLDRLGLGVARLNSQAVARDRIAEFVGWAALSGAVVENIATEIRNLQRTEIAELREPMATRQIGSSAMPHKRNPVLCENVCSLARLLRSLIHPALENVVSWHERDLANSANERFVIPQACVLLEEVVRKMTTVLAGLEVDTAAIARNLDRAATVWMSGALLRLLVGNGLARAESYRVVQECVRSGQRGERLVDELLAHGMVAAVVSRDDLAAVVETDLGAGWYAARARAVADIASSHTKGMV